MLCYFLIPLSTTSSNSSYQKHMLHKQRLYNKKITTTQRLWLQSFNRNIRKLQTDDREATFFYHRAANDIFIRIIPSCFHSWFALHPKEMELLEVNVRRKYHKENIKHYAVETFDFLKKIFVELCLRAASFLYRITVRHFRSCNVSE